MQKYLLQMTGSVAVQPVEIEMLERTDELAIENAVRRASNYYPVYYSGALWRVDPNAVEDPKLIAMLTGKVKFDVLREAKAA